MRPVPIRPSPLVTRLSAAALAVALAFAWGPPAVAQEVPARSLATTATTAVRDAASGAWSIARDLTASALDLIGIRYKWGGTTPESGLDCSGLVQFVFQQATGVTLPRSAKEMSRLGDKVSLADLEPGDLVFFNTRRFAFSHVGIYLGDNRFIHAPRRGREVEVATIDRGYWQHRFNGARRLIGVLPEMMPALVSPAAAATLEQAPAVDTPAELADTP
jgi:cell wall-associated NlpC family hydrolase